LTLALVGCVLIASACTRDDPTGVSDIGALTVASSDCGPPPERTGPVQLSSLPLTEAATLKSENSDTPTNIRFTNATCQTISLYWLDFEGNRVFYGDIPAGQSYVQNTFLTHPWVVTSAGGDLGLYLPVPDGANAQEAYIARRCSIRQKPLPPKITNGCGGTRG
jgi:hypothetical protein